MTLPKEVGTMNFFSCVATTDDAIPVIFFPSVGRIDEPMCHHW